MGNRQSKFIRKINQKIKNKLRNENLQIGTAVKVERKQKTCRNVKRKIFTASNVQNGPY